MGLASLCRMPEFIYVMSRARKAHGDKVILDDVTLSFLPGAKIGVVGPNGAGKSSRAQDHGRHGPAVQW
jgi:ABC-type polysaccharide/polyol phosphate transport system ATPase subunit